MAEGIDFSDARPGGAAIAAAGKAFVVRYVPYGGYRKGLTLAEVADYRANGLAIVLVYESTANRALAGFAAGIADAKVASDAMAVLGFPAYVPVYFGVDFDAQTTHQAAIDNYLRGAASVLGASRVGVYGGINVITRCRTNKSAEWFWQTYAWSGGKVAAWAHLYQYLNGQTLHGGSVDLDRSLQDNYGQWTPPISAGGMQTAGEHMITSGGITLESNYTARVLRDTPILKDATVPLGATAKAGYVYPYVGIPEGNNGLRAVVVQTAIPFADKGVRPCVLYLATADVVIEVVPPVVAPPAPVDTTPFSQADIDAAVADYKAKLDAANASVIDAAAKAAAAQDAVAIAQAALAPWQEYKAAHDKVGL